MAILTDIFFNTGVTENPLCRSYLGTDNATIQTSSYGLREESSKLCIKSGRESLLYFNNMEWCWEFCLCFYMRVYILLSTFKLSNK